MEFVCRVSDCRREDGLGREETRVDTILGVGAQHTQNQESRPLARPNFDHITIHSIVKEGVEMETLESISSLNQTLIQHSRPLAQGEVSESFRPRCPPHLCQKYGSLCVYGYEDASIEDLIVMTNDFLNETYGINSQVNFNKFKFNLLNFIFKCNIN